MTRGPRKGELAGVELHQPTAFWCGTAAITGGVVLHVLDFIRMHGSAHGSSHGSMDGSMHASMSGWPAMELGMLAILVGLALATYGVIPRRAVRGASGAGGSYGLRAMDDAPLNRAHWTLLTVLGVALVVDVMKPATLGFVLPGLREEYGISTARAALLPLVALTGTTVGSVVWGYLADRVGRRAAILLASLFFMATSICGTMPSFELNLAMCFLMGSSAGGMLPIVYALASESVSARNRGYVVVLHAGLGIAGGYLAASGAAALLEEPFGWRSLWLLGLPTGALIIVLNRWIPESPRFLLDRGRGDEARRVLARYGVALDLTDDSRETAAASAALEEGRPSCVRQLFRAPYLPHTATVGFYGVAWGLVNWGFLTFLPTILRDETADGQSVTRLLFFSALLAIPSAVVVAWLYGRWSSRKSMIGFTLGTGATLIGFAALAEQGTAGHGVLLAALTMLLLTTSSGMISMLLPYTSEIYPTHLRGRGSGVAAGASKVGGIVGPPLVGGLLTFSSGLLWPALVVAAPLGLVAVAMARTGIETRGCGLESIVIAQRVGGRPVPVPEGKGATS
jgi:putative MFS transporter